LIETGQDEQAALFFFFCIVDICTSHSLVHQDQNKKGKY